MSLTSRCRLGVVSAALLCGLLLPAPGLAQSQAEIRQRVLANIAQSQAARRSSKYKVFKEFNQLWQRDPRAARRWIKARRPKPQPRTTGPGRVSRNYTVTNPLNRIQPKVLFDTDNSRFKRAIMRKAGKMRVSDMGPWDKVDYLQKVIRQKVKHGGNELDFNKNPNRYNRFNARTVARGAVAKLSDYLGMGQVVCREMAFVTQAALQAAGFEARLVRGTIRDRKGKVVGGHAWNEIKLDGKWHIVDTTNPQFNKFDPAKASSTGTANGWKWERDRSAYVIAPPKPARQSLTSRLRGWLQR